MTHPHAHKRVNLEQCRTVQDNTFYDIFQQLGEQTEERPHMLTVHIV